MSRRMGWHGPYKRGAKAELRKAKRREAQSRNGRTRPENRRAYRLGRAS